MAVSGVSSIEKFVECPVCYDVFVSPQSLRCNHTLCKECVDKLKSKYNSKFYISLAIDFGTKIVFITGWTHVFGTNLIYKICRAP